MRDIRDLIRSSEKAVFCHFHSSDNALCEPLQFLGNDFSIFGLGEVRSIAGLLSHIDDNSESAQGIGVVKFHQLMEMHFQNEGGKRGERTLLLPLLASGKRIDVLANIYVEEEETYVLFLRLEYGDGMPDFETYIHGSFKDRLTGLFNYQTLRDHMRTNDKTGYLCLFDLNKFKEINDRFGHEIGDDVLTLLASHLISISTMEAGFYRRSGDEFFILFFVHDEALAKETIDDIDAYMRRLGSTSLKRCPGLECSASFGIVETVYDRKEKIDYEDYLKLADLAMYQAKTSHKKCHWISFDDALSILSSGTLDERLKEVLGKAKR